MKLCLKYVLYFITGRKLITTIFFGKTDGKRWWFISTIKRGTDLQSYDLVIGIEVRPSQSVYFVRSNRFARTCFLYDST